MPASLGATWLTGILVGGQLIGGVALADDQLLHNVTYKARVDGLARGAMISYKINDTQVQSANPAMLP
ncbi:MAG TPA: hypothetical protein VMU34_02785, partial [Mycobacterium sp.]|nr:hypothetical protein [Mycobacterium sp.]